MLESIQWQLHTPQQQFNELQRNYLIEKQRFWQHEVYENLVRIRRLHRGGGHPAKGGGALRVCRKENFFSSSLVPRFREKLIRQFFNSWLKNYRFLLHFQFSIKTVQNFKSDLKTRLFPKISFHRWNTNRVDFFQLLHASLTSNSIQMKGQFCQSLNLAYTTKYLSLQNWLLPLGNSPSSGRLCLEWLFQK